MNNDEFEKYTENIDTYTEDEIYELYFMNIEELYFYQTQLELNSRTLSTLNHINVAISFKKIIKEFEDKIKRFAEYSNEMNDKVKYLESVCKEKDNKLYDLKKQLVIDKALEGKDECIDIQTSKLKS